MSYKYDSYLVIANKFGSASGDAKAQLFETYDKLRDLTVSGSGAGTGFEAAGGFLYNLASLLAPASVAPIFGSSESMSIPGTSYFSNVATYSLQFYPTRDYGIYYSPITITIGSHSYEVWGREL